MKQHPTTRRQLLTLATGLATAATILPREPAAAMATMSKAQVGYQDAPRNGQVCAACVYFIFKPATGPTPASQCQLVAGPINPAGWCEVWATKA